MMLVTLSTLMIGCGDPPGPASPVLFALPLMTSPPNFGGCAGVGLDLRFVLDGDPRREPQVYARVSNGRLATITWPPGYAARFAPTLEIVGPNGMVVARQGDEITDDPGWPGLFACIGKESISIFRVADLHQ